MYLEPSDLAGILTRFQRLSSRLLETVANELPQPADGSQSPRVLSDTLREVFRQLAFFEPRGVTGEPAGAPEQDMDTLVDYAFLLIADLSSIADSHGEEELSHEIEDLSLSLAIWLASLGGHLSSLEPIVKAIAHQAKILREPNALAELYQLTSKIENAVIPTLRQDLEKTDPGRPWRLLLLNRAIIATRSHRPELMETAYESLIRQLPEEAADFFRQGMQQMDTLNYPDTVRQVVQRYFNIWSVDRTLH
jgi:hypothetical protein